MTDDEFRTELLEALNAACSTVARLQTFAAGADPEAEPFVALTEGVSERWCALGRAHPGSPAEGLPYSRMDAASACIDVYRRSLNAYQLVCEAATGWFDEAIYGTLDSAVVLANWSKVVAALGRPEVLPTETELNELHTRGRREIASVRAPVPPPQPVYAGSVSAELAATQRARVAEYREGEPFERHTPDDHYHTADVMLVAEGEPADRFVTKLGGVPYRPAALPWPTTARGEPLVFFGQVCFADSTDLVGELPGDVLLIFTHGEHDHTSGELRFEWYPLGIEELLAPADVPETPWRVFPCFMHLSRRAPEPDADEPPDWTAWAKIGGMPHWIQHEPRRYGTFLAAFESVAWLADPDPARRDVKHLDFFDDGLLNLCFVNGRVEAHFSCY
jgi:hypothetical protein